MFNKYIERLLIDNGYIEGIDYRKQQQGDLEYMVIQDTVLNKLLADNPELQSQVEIVEAKSSLTIQELSDKQDTLFRIQVALRSSVALRDYVAFTKESVRLEQLVSRDQAKQEILDILLEQDDEGHEWILNYYRPRGT